jgi:quercetin dioxygenase-like cupin family protein
LARRRRYILGRFLDGPSGGGNGMQTMRRRLGKWCVLAAAGALLLSGCLTRRERAVMSQFPRNRVFRPETVPELPPDKTHYLGEFDRSGSQGIYLLVLAPGAGLKQRYHADHDMVLLGVSGEAVVQVEQTRYHLMAGAAVLLPRLTAYSITAHQGVQDAVALMVFTPPFDGRDVVLVE